MKRKGDNGEAKRYERTKGETEKGRREWIREETQKKGDEREKKQT